MLTESRFLDTFRGHNVRPKLSRLKYMDPLHSLSPFPKGSLQFGHFAQQAHLTADKLEMRYCDKTPCVCKFFILMDAYGGPLPDITTSGIP